MMSLFPKNFVFGSAMAAYQVEGAYKADGKGLSIYDWFCRHPGRIFQGQSGDVACDHYHRYREDVALMKAMGLPAYRLSFSWPRIQPTGDGAFNEKGLDFYDRLIDTMLEAGVEPYVTLFHWDLPLAWHHRGGWMNREIVEAFGRYAEKVGRRFKGRVNNWITLNEPTITILCGYWEGGLAPGQKYLFGDVLRSAHHLLMSHGQAVQALRATSSKGAKVGLTHACAPSIPASSSAADIRAAAQYMFNMPAEPSLTDISRGDLHASGWWMDPIFLGRYPKQALDAWKPYVNFVQDGDLKLMSQKLDFFGLNIYHSRLIRAGQNGPEIVLWPVGHPHTLMNWPVTPQAHYWGPRFFIERYGKKPVYIFESGMSLTDVPTPDGQVHDPQRIAYHAGYLREFARAGQDGVPIAGYFVWSFLDVMEWSDGYKNKFGMVYIDHPNQLKRIPKDSYYWYQNVIKTHGEVLDGP